MKMSDFFHFQFKIKYNYENLLMKSYRYGKASREQTVKAARLKLLVSIDKVSVRFKKNGRSIEGLILELYNLY
jgi:hypothetical protein